MTLCKFIARGLILSSGVLFTMRRIFLTLIILLVLCNFSHAQEISGLSLEECLELAIMNHPSLKRAKSSTKDFAAQLESLRANNRVTVGLTGSARYDGDYDAWENREYSENLSLTASKLLYDTGRNRLQREIRKESLLGSEETLRNTQVTVAANANPEQRRRTRETQQP